MTNEKWAEIKKYLLYAIYGEGDPVERPADMDDYSDEIGLRLSSIGNPRENTNIRMYWNWINHPITGEQPTIRRGRIMAAKNKLLVKSSPGEEETWNRNIKDCYCINMSHLLGDLADRYDIDDDDMDEIWFTLGDIRKDFKLLEDFIADRCGEDDPRLK